MSIFTLILITQNSLTGSNLPVSHPPNRGGRKNKDIPLKEIPLAVLDEAAFDSVFQYIGFFQNVALK